MIGEARLGRGTKRLDLVAVRGASVRYPLGYRPCPARRRKGPPSRRLNPQCTDDTLAAASEYTALRRKGAPSRQQDMVRGRDVSR